MGALHGVPFTAKECIEVAGMPCCDASKIFEGNVSTQDATVVRNLRGEGAILLGKTNIPEFAFHYDSNNLVYGATHNPHNPERSVGGSSGGEGAALATGITPFGVGSDYGGSIRVPAHFNGVTGLKPGRWVVPYGGHFPPAQAMSIQLWSEIGPMARYIEDLRAAAADLREARLRRPTRTWRRTASSPTSRDEPARRDLRRGRHLPGGSGDPRGRAQPPAARWRTPGTRSSRSARPTRPRCARCSSRSRWREVDVAAVARDRAARGGAVAADQAPARSGARRSTSTCRPTRGSSRTGSSWSGRRAPGSRPTTSRCARSRRPPAFPIGTEVLEIDGQEYEEIDLFAMSTYVNAMGLPAAAVPVGRTPDGLPIGVQVIGRRYREMEVLAVAKELEAGARRLDQAGARGRPLQA